MLSFVFFVTVALCHSVVHLAPITPTWPDAYYVEGVLELPYTEIKEPFVTYYDGTNKKSRIDYYGDTVVTIQDASNNKTVKSYKETYISNDSYTGAMFIQRRCFLVSENITADFKVQGVLPDLTGFTYIGEDTENNASMWQMMSKNGNKKNTYTFWGKVEKNQTVPVVYEMMGYDTLLGSHYDKYYLRYTSYTAKTFAKNSTEFNPKLKNCTDFPGPGDSEHRVSMNPMTEYVNNNDGHTDDMFDKFKKTHSKNYKDATEHMERKHVFRQNIRFINSKNRAGLGYSLKVNHLADLSFQEMKTMRGYRPSGKVTNALPFSKDNFKITKLPESLDWRLFGAVTQVKDQAVCGSCWSFGTTGHIEGVYFIKSGELVRLSQQELMDCSWGQGNNGCDGGEDFRAYDWLLDPKNSLATEDDYGPYKGQNGMCVSRNVTGTVRIQGYHNITTGDLDALKASIVNVGPISVAIDASHPSFAFYSNGVYYEPNCGSKSDDLDHAVLAVGYGVMNGQEYWLVKNSWSTYWGNDGYVLMSQKDNNCGVATAATYVIM